MHDGSWIMRENVLDAIIHQESLWPNTNTPSHLQGPHPPLHSYIARVLSRFREATLRTKLVSPKPRNARSSMNNLQKSLSRAWTQSSYSFISQKWFQLGLGYTHTLLILRWHNKQALAHSDTFLYSQLTLHIIKHIRYNDTVRSFTE